MLPGRLFIATVVAALVILQPISDSPAQPPAKARNVFNPDAIKTLSGEVVSVDLSRTRSGRGCCLELTLLMPDKKKSLIHLGPTFYVEEQPIELHPKDKVDVTGSWVTRYGNTYFVASEVRKGDEILKLRDPKGRPLWIPPAAQPADKR